MVKRKISSNELRDLNFYNRNTLDELIALLEKQLSHQVQGDFFVRLFRRLFGDEPQLSRNPRFLSCSLRLRSYMFEVEQLLCSRKLGTYELVGETGTYEGTFQIALEINDLINDHGSRELQTSASSLLTGMLIAKAGTTNIC